MSRILRRPMFRGGRVSSYGTGIASGLADGGMPPKRGLVDGPGGYSGEGWYKGAYPNWQNIYGSTGIKGADVVAAAQDKWMQDGKKIYGPFSPYGEAATVEDMVGTGYGTGRNIDEDSTLLQFLYSGAEDPTLESSDVFMKEWVNEDAIKRQEYKVAKEEFETKPENKDKTFVDQETFEAIERENKNLDSDIKKEKIIKPGKSELELENEKLRKIIAEGLGGDDPTNVETGDLESMIGKYEDMLGMKKARGQDISDMLLRFAGSKGENTMDKFQEFFATEAKAGPGRAEKIKQAAAMLGIKGEQAQKLYETKLKNTTGQTQKAVEFIQSINPGMDADTALRLYLRQPASFAESLGIYKNKEGFLSDEGFLLAAGTFHRGKYKGNRNTDGSMEVGEEVDLADGVYTDKINRIIWTVKDKKVIESSGDRYKTTTK